MRFQSARLDLTAKKRDGGFFVFDCLQVNINEWMLEASS